MSKEGLSATQVVLGIHGGCAIEPKEMTKEREQRVRAGLEAALRAGFARLQEKGATSLDGVEAAVCSLEDCPEFNAGKGSVFTHDGRNELDAAIMDGKDKRAGSIAGATHIKNPITAARAVMEKSEHVFMIGRGAEAFSKAFGVEMVDAKYFWTDHRWQELEKAKEKEKEKQGQWGTVGAVALDSAGNLAVGTSTGGMVNKLYGRVGDTPIIGAGTYADNAAGAVSATGHGEYFIRYAVAHEILSLVKYQGMSIVAAADEVVRVQLKRMGGEGAVIALDPKGNFAMSRNCDGCYRGYATRSGEIKVFVYDM